MARSEEKANSMLNKWVDNKNEKHAVSQYGKAELMDSIDELTNFIIMNDWTYNRRRPFKADTVTSITECEHWRRSVIRDISKGVSEIMNGTAAPTILHLFNNLSQNSLKLIPHFILCTSTIYYPLYSTILSAGLGEYAIRDLNDKINKLIKEKGHWERQIKSLGGPNHNSAPQIYDAEGVALKAEGGYMYFGAARDLPGVRELFVKEESTKVRKKRQDLNSAITPDYFGYRDEDNGLLLKAEEKAEKRLIHDALEEHRALKRARKEVEGDYYISSSSDDDLSPESLLKSHVALPSQEDIDKLILQKKKEELLAKLAL